MNRPIDQPIYQIYRPKTTVLVSKGLIHFDSVRNYQLLNLPLFESTVQVRCYYRCDSEVWVVSAAQAQHCRRNMGGVHKDLALRVEGLGSRVYGYWFRV